MTTDLVTERVAIDSIEGHARNPRRGDVRLIAESLDRNGQYRPIVVRREGRVILAGHHTWRAAKSLGWSTIVVCWVDVDDATADRILLVDNRSNDVAGYEDEILAEILDEIARRDGEAALEGTGYDGDALAELLDRLADDVPDGQTDPDYEPPAPAKPIARPGDIWQLGPHRVACGDAADGVLVDRLVAGARVDALVSDPPYGVDLAERAKLPQWHRDPSKATIANDALTGAATYEVIVAAWVAALRHLRKGGAAYAFAPPGADFGTHVKAFGDAGLVHKQTLIWVKDRFVLGRQDHQWQHEPIIYGWRPGAAHRWHGGYTAGTVLDDERPPESMSKADLIEAVRAARSSTTVVRETRPGRSVDHPTTKPVALIAGLIENSTLTGERIIDPFGGSGTTLIAAHRTGREALLVELEPRYVDVICRRYQEHTGHQPTLERTGRRRNFAA